MPKKNVLVVCNLNRSRSPFIAKEIKRYFDERGLSVDVKSAGVNVHNVNEFDDRTPLERRLVYDADVILPTDYSVTNLVISFMTNKGTNKFPGTTIRKIHPLNIPDVFLPYGVDINPENMDHVDRLKRDYIEMLCPRCASQYVERLYQEDLESAFSTNQGESQRYPHGLLRKAMEYRESMDITKRNRIYPMKIVEKALEFRMPGIARVVEKS